MAYILLTRPIDQARSFARNLVERGISESRIETAPALEISPCENWDRPAPTETLLFTSANAVRIAGNKLIAKAYKAICVGKDTTEIAAKLGFSAHFGGQNVAELKQNLKEPDFAYHHLRGEHTTGDLAGYLKQQHWKCLETVLYRQLPQPLTPTAMHLLSGGTPVVLPLFSPRSAALVCKSKESWFPHVVVAISEAVKEVCKNKGFAEVMVAETATKQAMAEKVVFAYQRQTG